MKKHNQFKFFGNGEVNEHFFLSYRFNRHHFLIEVRNCPVAYSALTTQHLQK